MVALIDKRVQNKKFDIWMLLDRQIYLADT